MAASALRPVLACLAALALAGCGGWHYTINAPLEKYDPDYGYRFTNVARGENNSDEIFMIAMLSGGGMRASALAYAVLERLRDERVVWNGRRVRLLDELDVISAVSGGSMVAAYYGLHGDDLFRNFDNRFFRPRLQDQLESRVLSIASLPRLLSPRYGRIDLVQEFLDETLYDGKTFADLPRRRPFISISASDMAFGSRFEFDQVTFDMLCSDLDKLPIARAVAASSALPMVFSPVTLWNYAGNCSFYLPPRPPRAPGALEERQTRRLAELKSYLDRRKRPYIHLLDGGLADNIGARGLIETSAMVGGLDALMKAGRSEGLKKLVIIASNAETRGDRAPDRSADVPTLGQVMGALVDVPINRYSYESQAFGRQALADWQERRRRAGEPVEIYIVEVDLKDVVDPEEREFLNSVPTTLQLPRETIDRIRRAGHRLLDGSAEFQRLLESLR
jgi:NTE family protein